IPTNTPGKHYIIENRQKQTMYDRAWGKGLYIYRAVDSGHIESSEIYNPVQRPEPRDGNPDYYANPNSGNYDGYINLLSADGRYTFHNNLPPDYRISTKNALRITKGEPNIKGYDERDYCGMMLNESTGRWERYYAMYSPVDNAPWYYTTNINNAERHRLGNAFGDTYDGFSLNFNKVLSKWSNPGIDTNWSGNTNFSIEILSENPVNGAVSFRVRFTNPQDAPLGRPMGLKVSNQGVSYGINWYQANHPSTELQPGFSHYNVYYKTSSSVWTLLTSTTNTSLYITIPYNSTPNQIYLPRRSSFKITAVKSNGEESNNSDIVNVNLDQTIRTSSITIPSNYSLIIDDSLSVEVDDSFIMNENSSLILGNGSRLITNSQASLSIANNCRIEGNNQTLGNVSGSRIIANGSVNIGSNVSFSSDNKKWDGLEISASGTVSLNKIEFKNADLICNTDVSINEGNFKNSAIYQKNACLSVTNSQFDKAYVSSYSKGSGVSTEINYCAFSGENSLEAIQLNSIDKFNLNNNTIQGYDIGISLYETTNGYIERNNIKNNEIGIQLYHSGVSISDANIIKNNDYGIIAYRKSLWSLEGSKSMPYQKIVNNKYAQILFAYDSAPEYAEFNEIYNLENNAKPFVICTNVPSDPKMIIFNNNYLGTSFDPKVNLDPSDLYLYDSVWEPEDGLNNTSIIPIAYKSAKESEKNENYTIAKSMMQEYYTTVADTSILFDKASKHLLALEKLSTNNYESLLNIYQNYNGQDNETLNLYDYLQNYCSINQSQYQKAISWLENRIENPISQLDSLFATIDIGYVYMLIDDNKATNIVTNMEYLKPSSFSSYSLNRKNQLRNLLPTHENSEEYIDSANELSQVVL
ncbi:MAG TPA: hypothetical protein PKJ08_10900, partial [Candidatus Cloacimonadota bacterium]|nr:hypothetical protein [Candidatus Cloacimonadota bacterium]